jgi:hypothetical protein
MRWESFWMKEPLNLFLTDLPTTRRTTPAISLEIKLEKVGDFCGNPRLRTERLIGESRDGIGKQKNGRMEVGSGIAETIPIVHKLSMENWTETNNMNTPINDGGPAFPHPELVQDVIGSDGHVKEHRVFHAMPGMSLRDWFAGQALAGLLADGKGKHTAEKWAPHIACRIADAMLEARKDGAK